MLALVSWLIPYGVLDEVFAENSLLTVKIVSEFSQNLKQATNIPSLETNLISFKNVFYLLLLSGLILFLVDIIRYKQKTRKVELRSKYLYATESIRVFLIPDSDEIFTVGFFKPKIFVGEKYTKLKEFESIILHETQHVLHKDSLWLILITFIQRLMWWNPLVLLLAKRSREYIELSCDSACKDKTAKGQYQQDLAQVLMHKNHDNLLVNSFFGKSKFNVFRVKQLSEEFKMNKVNKITLSSTLIIPAIILTLLLSINSTSAKKLEEEPFALADNQVDLILKFSLETKNTDNTISTKRIESRVIAKFGEFTVLRSDKAGLEISIKPSKLMENQIFLDTKVTIISEDGNSIQTPSLMTTNGTESKIVIGDGNKNMELIVLPVFNQIKKN
ncbi:MAG: M56 family metallopeptidase [Gammaproteobacteria bacterium]|jgi:beta-lactamase regulating signal transducer with metallopeptidase domain